MIAQAEKEYKEKIRLLREDVDRSGGVYGGAELALLEQTGTYVRALFCVKDLRFLFLFIVQNYTFVHMVIDVFMYSFI